MRALIHNIPYPIDDGWTLNENYNETLDSATIRISHLTNEIRDLEPFDDVKIIELDRYMCIDSFDLTQEAIGQTDTTFTYTINLFSLTKKMEGIILPNLSITPHKENPKISIYEYLTRIRDLYSYKTWDTEEKRYAVNWAFSERFIDKFDSITCPEMQWSTPTFRELFNDLTMIGDSVVILRKKKENEVSSDVNFAFAKEVIDFLDLTKTNKVTKPFNYIRQSRSSDDYISEIRMDLQNVMQTNVEGINNVVTTAEFLTLTSNDAIITSENCYLKTQFPILNIKHLWLIVFCSDGTIIDPGSGGENILHTTYFKQDLCKIRAEYNGETNYSSLVYEQKDYDAKEMLYRGNVFAVSSIQQNDEHNVEDYYAKYKNFCLYYTRNSNIINGFSNKVKASEIFSPERSVLYYLKRISAYNAAAMPNGALHNTYGYAVANNINSTDNSYFNAFFQIEYETTYNAVFQASKGDRPNNNRVIADNQTNAWVDAYSQGFLEYQKANRLGNLQKMYNQRQSDTSNLYVIGDQIGDDIVYRTEYQFYSDHIECNAYATKNYVLRDYFTGIKSKIRTWVNAREEAFIRHDLKKYYCELSYSQNDKDESEDINDGTKLARYLFSPLYTSDTKPLRYALVRTKKNYAYGENPNLPDGGDVYWPDRTHEYALNCVSRLIGNSIVLTTGFEDNWVVDKHPNTGHRTSGQYYDTTGYIEAQDIRAIQMTGTQTDKVYPPYFNPVGNDLGGITTNYYRYCDHNGEFENINIHYLDELNVSEKLTLEENDDIKDLFIDLYNLPSVDDNLNEPVFGINMVINKDNKEKPVISTQLEFKAADEEIYFTDLFLSRQDMIRNVDKSNLTAYTSDTFSKKIPNDAISCTFTLSFGTVNDYCAVMLALATGNKKYLYICDADGNLIIVFNKDKLRLFLNIRRYM